MPRLTKPMQFCAYTIDGACSAVSIQGFDDGYWMNRTSFLMPSKTKLYVVMFTEKEESKDMYEVLCKSLDLQYQSEPSMGNHGLKVFLCVFKEKTK